MKLKITTLCVILLSSATIAATNEIASKIACMETAGNNSQCTYEVTGQEIDQPDTKSLLYGMSSMPYALCSTAVCTVNPDNHDTARCVCKVYGLSQQPDNWRKASVGPDNFVTTQPEFIDGQLSIVTSNFSFASSARSNMPRKQICKSKKILPWANCFGVRCHIVTGSNKYQPLATCDCPIVATTSFISMGPASRSACKLPKGKVWSGTTEQQGDNDEAVLKDIYQVYYPEHSINKILK